MVAIIMPYVSIFHEYEIKQGKTALNYLMQIFKAM